MWNQATERWRDAFISSIPPAFLEIGEDPEPVASRQRPHCCPPALAGRLHGAVVHDVPARAADRPAAGAAAVSSRGGGAGCCSGAGQLAVGAGDLLAGQT